MSPSMCLRESMYIWNLPVLSVCHPNTAQQRPLAIPCVFLTYSVVSGLSARPPISICHCVVRCAVPSYPPTNRAIVLSAFLTRTAGPRERRLERLPHKGGPTALVGSVDLEWRRREEQAADVRRRADGRQRTVSQFQRLVIVCLLLQQRPLMELNGQNGTEVQYNVGSMKMARFPDNETGRPRPKTRV